MKKKTDVKKLLSWVSEAQTSFQEWRADSWEDWEFRDGKQWTAADMKKLSDRGIRPVTINRIFPILNLLQGHYLNNRHDIVAKGRTKDDNELGQVMSEGIQFVVDQNRGHFKMARAFNQAITAGFGCLSLGFNPDPRRERIALHAHNWHGIWWDPYATPWMDKEECRYAFTAEWTDLDDIIGLFPEKEKEIKEKFQNLTEENFMPDVYDEATVVEDHHKFLQSGYWANGERKRVRPVEMWYPELCKCWFAKMPNGRVIEIDVLPPQEQYQVIQMAREVLGATVKKMHTTTFLSDLVLQDMPTPYVHDEYPFIPYVGYLDRFDHPFGVPRQIKEQDMEVNKRRTMALSLLNNRRVKIEEGSTEDENRAYHEANRPDGFIKMKKGKLNAIEIEEMSNLAPAQVQMMEQSEREIQEISGANDESLGYASPRRTGVAIEKQQQSTATITASLLENAKYSQKLLGERIVPLIQSNWTEEKVLRVTDRVTGAEKFVAINELQPDGITVRNDITQANFDVKVTNRPMTDTMREKNMDLIFSAINKAPPEAVTPLLNLALEISDIPNKDQLLQQIRQVTGANPINDDLTQAQREEQEEMARQAAADEQEKQKMLSDQRESLEQDEIRAKAEKLRAEAEKARREADILQQDVDQKGFQIGAQVGQMMNQDKDPKKPKKENNDKAKVVPIKQKEASA